MRPKQTLRDLYVTDISECPNGYPSAGGLFQRLHLWIGTTVAGYYCLLAFCRLWVNVNYLVTLHVVVAYVLAQPENG